MCKNEVGPEGKGKPVEDGVYEQLSVGGICRVNVYCVPDFYIIILQNLLSSIYWNRVVSDGSVVARSYGQVVSPLISFQTYVSFDQVEGDKCRLS